MIANEKSSRWYVLRTAYKSEHGLMQRLNAAGYTVFCPMQIIFKKWNGQTKKMYTPLFSGCLFVEEALDITLFATSQQVSVFVDNKGQLLTICANKFELSAKFAQLLK